MAYEIEIVKIEDVDLSILESDKITDPYMSSFEFTRLIACRDLQLKNNADPLIDVEGESNTLEVARKELYALVIPLVIQRTLPDGRTECWKVSELHIPD